MNGIAGEVWSVGLTLRKVLGATPKEMKQLLSPGRTKPPFSRPSPLSQEPSLTWFTTGCLS